MSEAKFPMGDRQDKTRQDKISKISNENCDAWMDAADVTYWNSEMIFFNADWFICQTLDNDFMTQALGFFIRMF